MTDSIIAVAVGLAAGLFSGAFGVGGGVVTTPAIRLLLGYPELIAVGTPLPVILPTAIAGALTHLRKGTVHLRTGVMIGVWGMPSSVLGALLSRVVGGSIVLFITSIVILLAAVDMVRPMRHAGTTPATDTAVTPARRVAFLGVLTGLYSGLLGLGGGFILVPLLCRFAGMRVKAAIGTSLVAVALLAVPGSITHWAIGNVDIPLALALTVGVVPGAVAGARLTAASGERGVRIAFAIFLVAVGLVLGLSVVGWL